MKIYNIKFQIFTILILALFSCKSDDIKLSGTDYIVFGDFYGMCMGGSCVDIYRIESDKLLEDTNDKYPSQSEFYKGTYVELSKEKYAAVKDLMNFFPQELLSEKDIVIGQPDAGDWGGFYIEYNYNGIRKFWILDKMKSNVPEKYHSFIDKLNAKLEYLQTTK